MGAAVVIDPRFNGPPGSANGGYACGVAATFVPGSPEAVEVTLRLPPPLGVELVGYVSEQGVELRDPSGAVVVGARAATLDLDVPSVSLEEVTAVAPADREAISEVHPYPTCFACGPLRDPADAVTVIVGPVPGRDGLFACSWTPPPALPHDAASGALDAPIVWAALDCPTAGACIKWGMTPHVLGRLTARIDAPVPVGEPVSVIAWESAPPEGRKRFGACALVAPGGAVLARSSAVWIALR